MTKILIVATLIISPAIFLLCNSLRVPEKYEYYESTTAAFNAVEEDLSTIEHTVGTEFVKLPQYERPDANQPIIDALEFIKFTKNTFSQTMEQNEELLKEIKSFDEKAGKVLSEGE